MTREDIRRFYALEIDFSALGVSPWSEADAPCFCTPADAECFASTGADGIHYCLLPGEETVYVVRPMCCEEGRYVLPVAEDFREFLSFLLCCGTEAALEQIAIWDEAQFRQYLAESPPAAAQVRAALEEAFQLEPADPFQKVKALQAAFDPAVLHFSAAYYDALGLDPPEDVRMS